MNKETLITCLLLLGVAMCHASVDVVPSIDLNKIAMIESSNNPNAIGDKGKAIGKYQTHACVVKEYNQYNTRHYSHADMFNPVKAKEVTYWYLHCRIPYLLQKRGLPVTEENILKGYNMGVGRIGYFLPDTTRNYLRKYRTMYAKN